MQIASQSLAGRVKPGHVRDYRRNPGNLDYALAAAAHTAKRLQEQVAVIPGNSYMHRVYHIARLSDSVTKYTGGIKELPVIVVNVDGVFLKGIATESQAPAVTDNLA